MHSTEQVNLTGEKLEVTDDGLMIETGNMWRLTGPQMTTRVHSNVARAAPGRGLVEAVEDDVWRNCRESH